MDETQTRALSADERERAAGMLQKINALGVEDAIARAERSEPDAAGRTWRIGAHVGKMVRQLLFWEGKGHADNNEIYKSGREWEQSEAGLTRGHLRTATRIAVEEGLLEIRHDKRPTDGRPTVFYRLDMWQVCTRVIESELANTNAILKHEGRKNRRDDLNRKRRAMEMALEDLNLLASPESANPKPEVEHGQVDQGTRLSSPGNVAKLTREPGEVAGVTEEVAVEVAVDSSLSGSPAKKNDAANNVVDGSVECDDLALLEAKEVAEKLMSDKRSRTYKFVASRLKKLPDEDPVSNEVVEVAWNEETKGLFEPEMSKEMLQAALKAVVRQMEVERGFA